MNTATATITDYVQKHTVQGECICGKCLPNPDAPKLGAGDHTINMELFNVAIVGEPTKEEFLKLTAAHPGDFGPCDVMDHKEHGFTERGCWIGDQGHALCYMALGVSLGVFKLLTPSTVMPFLDAATKQHMASSGMICVMAVG